MQLKRCYISLLYLSCQILKPQNIVIVDSLHTVTVMMGNILFRNILRRRKY